MRIVVLLLALFASTAIAGDTVAFGGRVITVGDTVGEVREAAGAPGRIVQLETPQGGAAGERWEYYDDGKTVLITINGGRVVAIEELR